MVTAEAVHSELPVYSEEVASTNSNASTLTTGSTDNRYIRSEKRKRIKSETSALDDTSSNSSEFSFRRDSRRGSLGFTNKSYMRCVNFFRLH